MTTEFAVFVAAADGTAPQVVTSELGGIDNLAWPPDGTRFAYDGFVPNENAGIYVIGMDGSGRHRVRSGGSCSSCSLPTPG